jgi:large subunit ribosomal protein L32e
VGLRRQVAQSRPRFERQESWRYKRVHRTWRRPKGIDSKMRLQVKGWPPLVKIGFRGPRASRGLHPSGLMERLVRSLRELEAVEPTREAARFAHSLGRRMRATLLARARLRGVRVLNPGKAPAAKEEETT